MAMELVIPVGATVHYAGAPFAVFTALSDGQNWRMCMARSREDAEEIFERAIDQADVLTLIHPRSGHQNAVVWIAQSRQFLADGLIEWVRIKETAGTAQYFRSRR